MRPLKLALKGFRSHRDRTEIDFRGRGLVGVVGPIGSGKSSILDGIAFALFAQTPAGGAATRALIHQQAASAHVDFWFESDGAVWRVVRALRRQGQAAHTLSRFSEVDDVGESIESFVLKADVDAKIQELLGMEFPAFSRSIMLAQGRFAQLLQATPTEANKVLQSVFGFDQIPRMRDVANTRVISAQAEITALGSEAHKVQEAKDRMAIAQEESKAASAKYDGLAELEPKIDVVSARQLQITSKNEALMTGLSGLEGAISVLPVDAGAVVMAEGSRAAAVDDARGVVVTANETMTAASADRKALVNTGTETKLSVGGVLIKQRSEALASLAALAPALAAAEARISTLESAVETAAVAVTEAEQITADALGKVVEGETAVLKLRSLAEQARRDHSAHDLRSHLAVGEACPVCEQSVGVLPARGDAQALTAAEEDLVEGQAALSATRESAKFASSAQSGTAQALSDHAGVAEAAQQEVVRDKQQVETLNAAVSGLELQLQESMGDGDPTELIATIQSDWDSVLASVVEAERAVAQAETSHAAAVAEGSQAAERFTSLSTAISVASDRLGLDQPVLGSVDGVEKALAAIDDIVVNRRTGLLKEQTSLTSSMAESVAELTGLLEAAGASDVDTFADAIVSAKAEMLRHTTTVDVMEKALAAGGDIVDRLTAAEATLNVYQALAKDLNPSRFLAFMLDEERAKLVNVSSVKLSELSGGRFGFALSEKGDIEMIDNTAAEYRRATSSLSGGETFLASLALALGLAEMVAGGTGTLDAFFLDEGFGSLDAEHLDLAMEGIEQLVNASPDRLVVVVSHVPELRERVEDLIVLDRDPDTGASILRSGGGARAGAGD